MSEITFRAKLAAQRRVTSWGGEFDLTLEVQSTLSVHLQPTGDPKEPFILPEKLAQLLDELRAPTGAVRFVEVTLRPSE